MFFLTIVRDYTIWHYSTALVSFVRLYKNFWWFTVQFFSIPQLAGSLFAPYKRITERRAGLFDIEAWLGFIIINIISRLIGFLVRICIIFMGIINLILLCLLAVVWYAIWLAAPAIISYCLVYGLYLLF
jgi:hypothetical protein